jgi:chemotaxis protein methyltransferase CheR
MLLRERFPQLADWQVDHRATDINREALERARHGRFSQIEVSRGLPPAYLTRYFEKRGLEWQLTASVRDRVRFAPVNLLETWPPVGPFDVVMVRNVLGDLAADRAAQVLGRIRRVLRPDGYLFVGAAESLVQFGEIFTPAELDCPGCYRPRDDSAR